MKQINNFKYLLFPCTLIISLLLFLILNDYLNETKPFFNLTFWGLYDSFVHGITAVLVLSPFLMNIKASIFALRFSIFYLIAILLDADHFIEIGKIDLKEAAALQMRPITHSLTFALLSGIIITVIYNLIKHNNRIANHTAFMVFWIVFASLSSHVIRDASSGVTPILFPIKIYYIPLWLYYCLELLLMILSFLLGYSPDKSFNISNITLK
jgi:hypothetical protein